MGQQALSVGPEPVITVNTCAGRLVVQVWDKESINVKGSDFEVQEKVDGKGVTVQSRGELRLVAPAGASLVIQQVHSDLLVKGVQGHVLIETAQADVIIRDAGAVDIHQVRADLVCKQLSGRLQAETIYGDVSLRQVAGAHVETVHGDLSARGIHGDMTVGSVHGETRVGPVVGSVQVSDSFSDVRLVDIGGSATVSRAKSDIRLYSTFAPGKHHFHAAGDITVRWPSSQPVKILATARKVINRLDLQEVAEKDGQFSGQIGGQEPETTLVLEAGNRVLLKEKDIVDSEWAGMEFDENEFAFDFDFSRLAGLGERIASRLNERFAQFETQLGGDLTLKIERQVEKAVRKAERAAERAARKAERAQRRGYKRNWTVDKPPARGPVATSEEQMRVLKMLEDGKISAQEASQLLDALS